MVGPMSASATQPATARFLVGVDGSETAFNAVRWAAESAAAHGAALEVLTAVQGVSSAASAEPPQQLVSRANEHLARAVEIARELGAVVEIRSRLCTGNPAEVLVAESERARRVVVGSRGLGDHSGIARALGSVAESVAMRADCPVAVVPESSGQRNGPVVVGVDGSEIGEPALAEAFAAASVRHCPLTAVHVWSDVQVGDWLTADSGHDWEDISEREHELLAQRLAGWQEDYPDVEVSRSVEQDRAVRALLQHGTTAQLLVVGSRGRGGMTGMLLGSTSRALLYAAPCPVLVVRAAVS